MRALHLGAILAALFNRYTARVVARNLYVWRKFLVPSFLGNFGEPFLYLLALGFGLGTMIDPAALGGEDYAHFIAPGLVLSTAMYTATFECTFGTFTRMKTLRIFEGILATPVRIEEVVAGEVWFSTMKGVVGSLVVFGVVLLFGLVDHATALFGFGVALLVAFLFSAMAMIVTALAPSYDFFSYFFTIFVSPMFLFSGIFFPLENLPDWARAIAWVFPLTHAVSLIRPLFQGQVPPALFADLAWLLVAALLCYVVAAVALRKRVIV
jgi:lipooligosaccharide transport system permease protein